MDNNKSDEYTIFELFQMLKADESWEPDKAKREELADAFYAAVLFL